MNLKEAEAMVEKLLPEWSSTVSSNFDGFANLLLDDYEDWARDTLECVLDPCEDEFDRTLEEWWTDREVSYKFTASGLVLYIGSYHSNWHDLKYIDYQAWDND